VPLLGIRSARLLVAPSGLPPLQRCAPLSFPSRPSSQTLLLLALLAAC
jgi:hypothetical protein